MVFSYVIGKKLVPTYFICLIIKNQTFYIPFFFSFINCVFIFLPVLCNFSLFCVRAKSILKVTNTVSSSSIYFLIFG